jgi:riboflavin biosynthesis pyrimidine reductase
VLIVAGDPMVAALLGMLLDPDRHEPVFPQNGERPEDAVGRLRPPIAILLDGELESAGSDLFVARADRARATLVLFTPPAGSDAARALAAARGIPCFTLPVERAALTRILDDALRRGGVALGVMALAVGGVAGLIASLPRGW